MSTVSIGNVYEFNIVYDTLEKEFQVQNKDGDILQSTDSQEDAEKAAKRLKEESDRSKFKFPIPAFEISEGGIYLGRVTSINQKYREMWFSYDEKMGWRSRGKYRIGSPHTTFFKKTLINEGIKKKVDELNKKLEDFQDDTKKQIGILLKGLNEPLDLKFFGLEE